MKAFTGCVFGLPESRGCFVLQVASIEGGLAGVLTGHSDWVFSIAFSPDGKLDVSGSVDNAVLCKAFGEIIRSLSRDAK
jgi:WD40 repeat protein